MRRLWADARPASARACHDPALLHNTWCHPPHTPRLMAGTPGSSVLQRRAWQLEAAPVHDSATMDSGPSRSAVEQTSMETVRRVRATSGEASGAESLLSQLLLRAERAGVAAPPRSTGTSFADEMQRGAQLRALSTLDAGRIRTMLGWVEEYQRAGGDQLNPFFISLNSPHDVDTSQRNASALEGLAEYMRRSGSRATGMLGKTLRSDSIQTVLGTARTVREVTGRGGIIIAGEDYTSTRVFKSMRRDDGPSGVRASQRALRALYFQRALENGYDIMSAEGERRWAAGLVAHNALLRGGEVGRVERRDFSADHGLTFSQIEWRKPCAASSWLAWLVLWVLAIKDQNHRNARQPILIRQRRAVKPNEADDMCAYWALFRVYLRCVGCTPPPEGRIDPGHEMAQAPVFAHESGEAFDTDDAQTIFRDIAAAAGEDPMEFGARSARAGGATDLRDVMGAEAIPLIKQRGRWGSDIAEIYQRALAGQQLQGSARMGDATDTDVETMVSLSGWRQRR
jgi:hypothetical protein